MKNLFWIVIAMASLLVVSCNNQGEKQNEMNKENPLLQEWNTPYGIPPFEQIKHEHYIPAFEKALCEHNAEIEAIVNNTEEATFENTIEALDYSGQLLGKVSSVFFNLLETITDEEMQKIAQELNPMLSAHGDEIKLNQKLFAKIKSVYDNIENLDLNIEERKLLTNTYHGFTRGGANIAEADKEEFMKINSKLSTLSLNFGDNQLAETNNFKLVIDKEEDLAGLPESVRAAAAETAKACELEGKWVFTLHKPSLIPFLQYSEKRDLREQMHTAYCTRCSHDNEFNNIAIAQEMTNLRLRKAQILGYNTYAEFVLENNMAKNPETAYDLLNQVMIAANKVSQKEADELQKFIDAEGNSFKLEDSDWWYYAEKLKKEKYQFDDEALRPYFKLENVKQGVFTVAEKLYGIKMVENKELPTYHPEATAYEVQEADGTLIGICYFDFFPRASKSSGAWMTEFRGQSRTKDGENIMPIISTVYNFSKPTGDKPALLNSDEVGTLFHEFGHALHGLLSDCKYPSLAGTSVPRDFVELPSQVLENWAFQPEVLKLYAKNHETGEVIPQDLIDKMNKASLFNQGFVNAELLSAAILDMDLHNVTEPIKDITAFEANSIKEMGLIDEIVVRYRPSYFAHLYSGGYSAGYYAYTWSAVLDADAFQVFKEKGLFDKESATSFRENVLSKGNSGDLMELYVKYRGQEPTSAAHLERTGLN